MGELGKGGKGHGKIRTVNGQLGLTRRAAARYPLQSPNNNLGFRTLTPDFRSKTRIKFQESSTSIVLLAASRE